MINGDKEERQSHAPDKGPPYGLAEVHRVSCTDIAACHSLTGIGKTISEIREYHQDLHHDGAHREKKVAVAC